MFELLLYFAGSLIEEFIRRKVQFRLCLNVKNTLLEKMYDSKSFFLKRNNSCGKLFKNILYTIFMYYYIYTYFYRK